VAASKKNWWWCGAPCSPLRQTVVSPSHDGDCGSDEVSLALVDSQTDCVHVVRPGRHEVEHFADVLPVQSRCVNVTVLDWSPDQRLGLGLKGLASVHVPRTNVLCAVWMTEIWFLDATVSVSRPKCWSRSGRFGLIYHHCSLCAARGISLGLFGDDGIERHGNNVESGTTEPRPE